MKRTYKIISYTALSILILLLITISLVIGYFFTPSKLTAFVQKKASEQLTCTAQIKRAELTFFRTFPHLGITLEEVCLTKEETEQAASDTLLSLQELTSIFDLKELIFNKSLIINQIHLKNGQINYLTDTLGRCNWGTLFQSEKMEEEKGQEEEAISPPLKSILLEQISLHNINLHYADAPTNREVLCKDLSIQVEGEWSRNALQLEGTFTNEELSVALTDSVPMHLLIAGTSCKISIKQEKEAIAGNVQLQIPTLSFNHNQEDYLKGNAVEIALPFILTQQGSAIHLSDAHFRLDQQEVSLSGDVREKENKDLDIALTYKTNTWDIPTLLDLLPTSYKAMLKDLALQGTGSVDGRITGVYNATHLPHITANMYYLDGKVSYKRYPTIRNIQTHFLADLQLNEAEQSSLQIQKATATIHNSNISLSGSVKDLLDKKICNLAVAGDLKLSDFQGFIPQEINAHLKGALKGAMNAQFQQADLEEKKMQRIQADGNFTAKNLNIRYNDSIQVESASATILFNKPQHAYKQNKHPFITSEIQSPLITMAVHPSISTTLTAAAINMQMNDWLSNALLPITQLQFKADQFSTQMDNMQLRASMPEGNFLLGPSVENKELVALQGKYSGTKVEVTQPGKRSSVIHNITATAELTHNKEGKTILEQWSPTMAMQFSKGNFQLNDTLDVQIPLINFQLTPEKMVINQSKMVIGRSDFNLEGTLKNINPYLLKEDLLKGDFQFKSDHTDVEELMSLVNGFGVVDSTQVETVKKDSTLDDPFMVPRGVDICLQSQIENATVNQHDIQDVKGKLTIKDGSLILEQMGFTSKAANMQLTAIYRSERKNHLFTGLDFHLLNVDIKELIDLVPNVDSILPMLKSFDGRGEFHLAAETYLKSNYEVKMSTLRGAAAIEGHNLILMDNSTFSEIAKKLHFNKKTRNTVDSISAEMTIFRNEVDLYPFLIVMDKYKAVIAGRHNMDMSFNYHISLTDCPLPIRLGLNINGTMDNLKFKLARCKYKHLYQPKKQGALEKRILSLKKIISSSLKKNVKPVATRN
ncbi:MAG: AsmA-like C-terminal region-containing protein [Bacteroidaceae bacterium]